MYLAGNYHRNQMIHQIRSVLALPWAYQLFFNVIGAPERSRILVREYIRPQPGDRILEIGCGPGTIVPFLPESEYLGFDASPEYIELAQKRFPRARFVCERVSQYTLPHGEYFDIVLALGIVHHLDDSEALQLFRIAHGALKQGGKLVTLDGVWTNDQSRPARYLLARDRGQFVRSREKYVNLASQVFSNTKASIRHDLLRIPYTHIILECIRGQESTPKVNASAEKTA
jgi:SAM-dependent methyltransferase